MFVIKYHIHFKYIYFYYMPLEFNLAYFIYKIKFVNVRKYKGI